MTNRQLVERIVGDLTELINRGNTDFTPQLAVMRAALAEISNLELMIAALNRECDPCDYDDANDYYEDRS